MGFHSASQDDDRLFDACERVLLGISQAGGDVSSAALKIRELVARLPPGCADDVSIKHVRKVLLQHQDILVPLPDDVSFVHVSKFNEQVQRAGMGSAAGAAAEPDDAACNFWDAPATLGNAEQDAEGAQCGLDGGQSKSATVGNFDLRHDVQESALTSTAKIGGPEMKNGLGNEEWVPSRAGALAGAPKESAMQQNVRGRQPEPGPSGAILSSCVPGRSHSAHAHSGLEGGANAGGAALGGGARRSVGPLGNGPIDPGLGKAVDDKGSRHAASGVAPGAPGGASQGGGVGNAGGGERKIQGIQEEIVKLKHCQDEIRRLLAQRAAMEAALQSRLDILTCTPGRSAEARQLAATLAQLGDEMRQIPGAEPGPSTPSRTAASLCKACKGAVGAATVSAEPGGRPGGGQEEGLKDGSDVEVMDAPPAANEWARKREAAQKRRREGRSADGGGKRPAGPRAQEQGAAPGTASQSEREDGGIIEEEVVVTGTGTGPAGVKQELSGGPATPSAAVVAGQLASTGRFGKPGSSEARPRNGVQPSGALPTRFWPGLVAVVEELVLHAQASGAALTRATVTAELERRGIVIHDVGHVDRALAAAWDKVGKGGPATSKIEQLPGTVGQPKNGASRSPPFGAPVKVQVPNGSRVSAEAKESPNVNTQAASTVTGFILQPEQTARPRTQGKTTSDKSTGSLAMLGRQDAPGTKVVGLGLKRKRHGAAPKHKRSEFLMQEMEGVLGWNLHGHDEMASTILESLLGGGGAPAFSSGNDAGRRVLSHVFALGMARGIEAEAAEVQTRSGKSSTKHRKQDHPRRLVNPTQTNVR